MTSPFSHLDSLTTTEHESYVVLGSQLRAAGSALSGQQCLSLSRGEQWSHVGHVCKAAARPALRGGLVSSQGVKGAGKHVPPSLPVALFQERPHTLTFNSVKRKELSILVGLRKGKLLMTNYAESATTVKYMVY